MTWTATSCENISTLLFYFCVDNEYTKMSEMKVVAM
jgi:hypothetical protein